MWEKEGLDIESIVSSTRTKESSCKESFRETPVGTSVEIAWQLRESYAILVLVKHA